MKCLEIMLLIQQLSLELTLLKNLVIDISEEVGEDSEKMD